MRKLAILMCVSLLGAAPPPSVERPPGEGVLCAMAFVDVAAEAGRRCFPGQDTAFQTRIEQAERQFDAYVLKNGPATPEQLAQMKRQSGIGNPEFDCTASGDPVTIYKHMEAVDPQKMASGIKETLARPGKPTIGDCT